MSRAKKYLKPYLKELTIGPFFKLLEAIFELIVPLVMASIIDVGVKNRDTAYVWKMGGVMVLLGIVGLGCALICQYFAARASQGVGTLVRNDLFKHINSLSHAEIDAVGTSSLITRMINDINQVQQAVAMLIRLVVRAPFIIIGAAALAMMLDFKLSLIFLAAAPIIALIIYVIMTKSVPFYRMIQKKLDRISLITRENLLGARIIRAFGRQEAEKARFDEASDDLAQTAVNIGKISALLNPLTFTVMYFAIIAVLWFGGIRVDIGFLTQGEIITFVSYMTQISLTLVIVANLVVLFTKASASLTRINEVFELSPSVTSLSDKTFADPSVSFENVSFSYGKNGETALDDITFSAKAGETIGIIGGTGSGKSTLVNLIPRFYDVTGGGIKIGGVDIKQIDLDYLRENVGIVLQKASLFSGTIRDNMLWSNSQASDEQIAEALAVAQAEDFVMSSEKGLDTPVLQGGKNLSGGQRQRLTIARALVKNPKILILDDSASALDFATDAKLRKAIAEKTRGMTVFIVSQRAASVMYSDKIIVLDDGCAVGIGTHDELMASCEIYKEICSSQL